MARGTMAGIGVAAALLLAGCLGTTQSPVAPQGQTAVPAFAPFVPEAPDFDFATVVDPDHLLHSLPLLHEAGHGLDLAGFTPIQPSLPAGTRGSITQVDVWDHYAALSGFEGGLGFAIVDIADPQAPKVVGVYPAAADGWTARFSDDGQYVFYGCQVLGALGAQAGGTVKGTCEDPMAIHPGIAESGIVAVDVSDKAEPKFVGFLATAGSHNIQVTTIGGEDIITTAATTILRFDRKAGELVELGAVAGRHDSTVATHPVTGDHLLYTGTDELTIYNLNDPAAPEPVFEGGVEGVVGWHEQTPVPGLVDGRALLVVAGETFSSPDGGVPDKVSVLDITDPSQPVLLSQWQPPFVPMLPWISYTYSVHEMAATPTGQVAVAWYHGGVWVLDLSTQARQAAPVVLAAYQPHEALSVVPSTFPQTPQPLIPMVWGANWDPRGYLVVPDMHTGLYVLEPAWGLHPSVDGGQ